MLAARDDTLGGKTCLDVAAEYGEPGNYLAGANIAGFARVVNAMLDQGLV